MRTDNEREIKLDHCIIEVTDNNELKLYITRLYEENDPSVEYHEYVLKFNNRTDVVQAVELFSQLRTDVNAVEVARFLKGMYHTISIIQHAFGGDLSTKTAKVNRVWDNEELDNDFVASIDFDFKFASGFHYQKEFLFDTTYDNYCLEDSIEFINNKHLKYLGVK